jgi:hypothetical protein
MDEVTSLDELFRLLRGVNRIGIDGTNGVRKSSVADFLGRELELPVVHTDDFLEENQGGYVEFLRYDVLGTKLGSLEKFVVEGVCLLQVLERSRVSVDAVVYIKRYHLGLWADERELNVPLDQLDEFLEKERELVELMSGEKDDGSPQLSHDVVRYHSRFKPHTRAHVLYRWDDN